MICWDDNLLGGKEGKRKFPLVQYDSLFWYPYKMTQLKPAYVRKLPCTNMNLLFRTPKRTPKDVDKHRRSKT